MSRTQKGRRAPGFDYWAARPGNRCGGSWSPNGNKQFKRQTHKAERRTEPHDIAEQLVDVYTLEELMADICKPEAPCAFCKAQQERLKRN